MLTPEQVKEMIALTEQTKAKALAEYHRSTGFIQALKLFDGSVEIIEDEDGKTEGSGCPVASSGGKCES